MRQWENEQASLQRAAMGKVSLGKNKFSRKGGGAPYNSNS